MLLKVEDLEGKQLYRLTNEGENHRGFQYKDGLNEDIEDFNPSGTCESGGLYFFELEKIGGWLHSGGKHHWIREVTLPKDEPVWQDECEGKYKAKRIILGTRVALSNFKINDPVLAKKAVEYNYNSWKFVELDDDLLKMCLNSDDTYWRFDDDDDDDDDYYYCYNIRHLLDHLSHNLRTPKILKMVLDSTGNNWSSSVDQKNRIYNYFSKMWGIKIPDYPKCIYKNNSPYSCVNGSYSHGSYPYGSYPYGINHYNSGHYPNVHGSYVRHPGLSYPHMTGMYHQQHYNRYRTIGHNLHNINHYGNFGIPIRYF